MLLVSVNVGEVKSPEHQDSQDIIHSVTSNGNVLVVRNIHKAIGGKSKREIIKCHYYVLP